ncbi:MAG: type III pantothenate kinase, partial [Rhodobacterales bacterium]|nr:type III pantothenate kinase [Rhodobacterales bacterium]
MLLAIDCGNTNTVFSIWDGSRFLATWRMATDHRRTADEYFVWLRSLVMLGGLEVNIRHAIISSTVPRVVFNLRVLCNRYFDCRPLVVGKPECRLPVAPRVDAGVTVGP